MCGGCLFGFFPCRHWTKLYCLGKGHRCKLRAEDTAQKTVNSVTFQDDESLS